MAASRFGDVPERSVATPDASVGDDPLYPYQWHLKNTGQRVFADGLPKPGIDLNIADLHEIGITGKGVVVGMREIGRIDADHEDLAANMVLGRPADPDAVTSHATLTAGLIAAVGWNGKGGRGVAPDARILDLSRAYEPDVMPRVINASVGCVREALAPYGSYELSADYWGSYNDHVLVKSAGNDFLANKEVGATPEVCREVTRGSGGGCISVHMDLESCLPHVVSVAAVNASGVKASYSSTGSAVWISGLGGERGLERQQATASNPPLAGDDSPGYVFEPALVSLDVSSCGRGMDQQLGAGVQANRLDSGGASALDPNCNYTALANGTSAAAPTVTGVIALMLQVNPALTWRDIKYILAVTARKIDPALAPKQSKDGFTIDDGWVVNAAGRSFSNWYGFGLVDAKQAVEAARDYPGLPPMLHTGWVASEGGPVQIPYGTETGGYSAINVQTGMYAETVHVRLRTTHHNPQNLRVSLISPSGTRSIVLPPLTHIRTKISGEPFSTEALLTNAFLNEQVKGEWKLQVIDILDSHSDPSSLVSWELFVLGH